MKHRILMAAAGISMVAFAASAQAGGLTVAEKDGQKLTIGGTAFLSALSYKKDTAGTTTARTTGVAVDRFYIDMRYKADDVWSARFNTDINNEHGQIKYTSPTGAATTSLKRNQNVFVKYAFIEGKFSDAVALRFGQSHTPWIDYEEGLWKHRYASNVATDFWGFESSSDLGIGLKGKVADGMVNYFVTYTNGGGYGNPSASDAMDLSARVSVKPIEGLDVALGYKSGYNGSKTLNVTGTKQDLTQVMVAYGQKDLFEAGANYITSKKGTVKTTATSLWGWGNINEQFGAFAHFDNTSDDAATKTKQSFYLVGVEYFAGKGVTLALTTRHKEVDVGGTKTKEDWTGIQGQLKF